MSADAGVLRRWLAASVDALGARRGHLDAINVFPVADSDTGTNLWLTLADGLEAVRDLPAEASDEHVSRAFARGALLGARGNSGVVVSQYLSAFLEALTRAGGPSSLDGAGLARCLAAASAAAYEALAAPIEGTVVTVGAAAARAAEDAAAEGHSPAAVAIAAATAGRSAVRATTEQLDVARDAGVVDAGALGLSIVLDQMVAVLSGAEALAALPDAEEVPGGRDELQERPRVHHDHDGGGIYEVMFVSGNTDPDGSTPDDAPGAGWRELSEQLGRIGDSVAVTGIRGLVQAHVHTNKPDDAVEIADTLGSSQILVRNIVAARERLPELPGVVALTRSPGLAAALADTGAIVVVIPSLAGLTQRELLRAVRDASGTAAVVVAGDPELRAAAARLAEGRTSPTVEVLRVQHEAQLVAAVAASAFVTDPAALAEAMADAAEACIAVTTTADALDDDVDRLLSSRTELVTVILPEGTSASVADSVRLSAAAICPEADVIVHEGRHTEGGIFIGVESST
jgi:dihydroxyacetone kinase-like predicted kinase